MRPHCSLPLGSTRCRSRGRPGWLQGWLGNKPVRGSSTDLCRGWRGGGVQGVLCSISLSGKVEYQCLFPRIKSAVGVWPPTVWGLLPLQKSSRCDNRPFSVLAWMNAECLHYRRRWQSRKIRNKNLVKYEDPRSNLGDERSGN